MECGGIFFGTFEKYLRRKFGKYKKVNYICTTMRNDLEKTTTHGRISSVQYTFGYSTFAEIVTLKATWNNLNENERIAIPAEKIDELIDFLQDAKAMYNLSQYKEVAQ